MVTQNAGMQETRKRTLRLAMRAARATMSSSVTAAAAAAAAAVIVAREGFKGDET